MNLHRLRALSRHLALDSETHAFCGAIAFFSLLSFYPSSFLLLALLRRIQDGSLPERVLFDALREYYPQAQGFLLRNLNLSVIQFGGEVELASGLWMLLGAAGIFIPLETALNRAFGFSKHRPYLANQAVGAALTLTTGGLALGAVLLASLLRGAAESRLAPGFSLELTRLLLLRGVALAATFAVVLLWFRFLPNGDVKLRQVLPEAVVTALAAHAVHGLYGLALPLLQLPRAQGPFYVTVGFALLVYFEAFVLVGGAFLAGTPGSPPSPPEVVPPSPPEVV